MELFSNIIKSIGLDNTTYSIIWKLSLVILLIVFIIYLYKKYDKNLVTEGFSTYNTSWRSQRNVDPSTVSHIYGFGQNKNNILGKSFTEFPYLQKTYRKNDNVLFKNVKDIEITNTLIFLKKNDGHLYVAGIGKYIKGDSMDFVKEPVKILDNCKEFKINGNGHVIAIDNDNKAWLKGRQDKELKDTGINNAFRIGLTSGAYFVVTRNQELYAKGNGWNYIFGNNNRGHLKSWTKIEDGVANIFPTNEFSLIFKNSKLYTTGRYTYGASLQNYLKVSQPPVTLKKFTEVDLDKITKFVTDKGSHVGTSIREIYCSGSNTYIMSNKGYVWGVGDNRNFQLGEGPDTTPRKAENKTFVNVRFKNGWGSSTVGPESYFDNSFYKMYCPYSGLFTVVTPYGILFTGLTSNYKMGIDFNTGSGFISKSYNSKPRVDKLDDLKGAKIVSNYNCSMILKKNNELWVSGKNENGIMAGEYGEIIYEPRKLDDWTDNNIGYIFNNGPFVEYFFNNSKNSKYLQHNSVPNNPGFYHYNRLSDRYRQYSGLGKNIVKIGGRPAGNSETTRKGAITIRLDKDGRLFEDNYQNPRWKRPSQYSVSDFDIIVTQWSRVNGSLIALVKNNGKIFIKGGFPLNNDNIVSCRKTSKHFPVTGFPSVWFGKNFNDGSEYCYYSDYKEIPNISDAKKVRLLVGWSLGFEGLLYINKSNQLWGFKTSAWKGKLDNAFNKTDEFVKIRDNIEDCYTNDNFTALLTTDGKVLFVGGIFKNRRDGSAYTKDRLTKLEIPNMAKVKKIFVTHSSIIAFTEDNRLYGFGSNTSGQLGLGDRIAYTHIFKEIPIKNPVNVFVGPNTTYVKTAPVGTLHKITNGKEYIFTSGGKTGRYGPSQEEIDNAYKAPYKTPTRNYWQYNLLYKNVKVKNGIQHWTVPETAYYEIECIGASSPGSIYSSNNYQLGGMVLKGTIVLEKGDKLKILVGQPPNFLINNKGRNFNTTGGAGGTFIIRGDDEIIMIAGGSGGIYNLDLNTRRRNGNIYKIVNKNEDSTPITTSNYSGSGAGFTYDGSKKDDTDKHTIAKSFKNGGVGGESVNAADGGFGGGAGIVSRENGTSTGSAGGGGWIGGTGFKANNSGGHGVSVIGKNVVVSGQDGYNKNFISSDNYQMRLHKMASGKVTIKVIGYPDKYCPDNECGKMVKLREEECKSRGFENCLKEKEDEICKKINNVSCEELKCKLPDRYKKDGYRDCAHKKEEEECRKGDRYRGNYSSCAHRKEEKDCREAEDGQYTSCAHKRQEINCRKRDSINSNGYSGCADRRQKHREYREKQCRSNGFKSCADEIKEKRCRKAEGGRYRNCAHKNEEEKCRLPDEFSKVGYKDCAHRKEEEDCRKADGGPYDNCAHKNREEVCRTAKGGPYDNCAHKNREVACRTSEGGPYDSCAHKEAELKCKQDGFISCYDKEEERLRIIAMAEEEERLRIIALAEEEERLRRVAFAEEEERLRRVAFAEEEERLRLAALAAEEERLRLAALAAEEERLRKAALADEEERLRKAALAAEEEERLRKAALAAEEERLRKAALAAEEERLRKAALAEEEERLRMAVLADEEERLRILNSQTQQQAVQPVFTDPNTQPSSLISNDNEISSDGWVNKPTGIKSYSWDQYYD